MVNVQGNTKIKRYLGKEESVLEKTLYAWMCQKRLVGEPITGVLLKEQAKMFNENIQEFSRNADENGNDNAVFKASDGWLANFKRRHGLRMVTLKGEKQSADTEASATFIETFQKYIQDNGYDLDDIFNADEFGLEFKSIPKKTYVLGTEKETSGHKPLKDRLTGLACSNATGTLKIPLMLIGKSKNPRCFKNKKDLPIQYKSQNRAKAKAWMNTEIFLDWYKTIFLPTVTKWKPNGRYKYNHEFFVI